MMKKVSFLILALAIVASISTVWGQTKTKKVTPVAKKTTASIVPVLKTENDSISYLLGINLVNQGLVGYLGQQGVLADTAAITADYQAKIQAEDNAAQKTKLENLLKAKLDSANTVNKLNVQEFLKGFNQSMNVSEDRKAFNTGLSIAGQVKGMTDGFGTELLGGKENFNNAAFLSAFCSTLEKSPLLINVENPQEMLDEKTQKKKALNEAKLEAESKGKYAAQIAVAEEFLAQNSKKDGVAVTPSGLQYKILTEGTGAIPEVNDKVRVHYHGTLIDGTVFDSSIDRGEPAEFAVGQLIRGFNEALLMMPAGSKWIVYIPSDLAYGAKGQGSILPFSTLVFEIDLLEVLPQGDAVDDDYEMRDIEE